MVGAGVVVRHSQHCGSEQMLFVQGVIKFAPLRVQTPLHAHDEQSVGRVVVVLWKQHCSLVHIPLVQTMSLKDAWSRVVQGSPGQANEAHVGGGAGVVVITKSQQSLREQPPPAGGQTIDDAGFFDFHPCCNGQVYVAQVGGGAFVVVGVVVVHTQQKAFVHPRLGHTLSFGNGTRVIPNLFPHRKPTQVVGVVVGTGVVVTNLQHHLRSHPAKASIPIFKATPFWMMRAF